MQNQKINQDLSHKAVLLEQAASRFVTLQKNYDSLLQSKKTIDREPVTIQEQSGPYQKG